MSEQRSRPGVLYVIDDNASLRRSLALEFLDRGYHVYEAATGAEVRKLIQRQPPDFAIVDLKLKGEDGLQLARMLNEAAPGARILILTGHGTISTAVAALKSGAIDYLTKPTSADRIEHALRSDEPPPRDVVVPESRESLARHEREYLEYVLAQCDGNVTRAARWLGIHRQSLQRKLRKFPVKR